MGGETCLYEAVFACLCAKMSHTNPTTTLTAEFLAALGVFGDTPNLFYSPKESRAANAALRLASFSRLVSLENDLLIFYLRFRRDLLHLHLP